MTTLESRARKLAHEHHLPKDDTANIADAMVALARDFAAEALRVSYEGGDASMVNIWIAAAISRAEKGEGR